LFATTEVFLAFKAKGCAGLGEVGGGFSPETCVETVHGAVGIVSAGEGVEGIKDEDAIVHSVKVFSTGSAGFSA
jgi:hypothetical protein